MHRQIHLFGLRVTDMCLNFKGLIKVNSYITAAAFMKLFPLSPAGTLPIRHLDINVEMSDDVNQSWAKGSSVQPKH